MIDRIIVKLFKNCLPKQIKKIINRKVGSNGLSDCDSPFLNKD